MPRGRILRAGELEPEGYGQTGQVTREGGEVLRMFEQSQGQRPGQGQMPGLPQGIDMPKGLVNRRKYESFLKEKYGNPYEDERDLIKNINQTTRTNERGLFEYVFGDNFRYEDRKHLDTKAQSHWKNSLLKYRKSVEDELEQDIESRKEMFENQMKSFDDYTKMFKPAKPTKPKRPTSAEYKRILDIVTKINEEGQVTKNEMVILNKLTEGTDINVENIITQEAKEKMWWPDVPEERALRIMPKGSGQRMPNESIKDYLKRTGR